MPISMLNSDAVNSADTCKLRRVIQMPTIFRFFIGYGIEYQLVDVWPADRWILRIGLARHLMEIPMMEWEHANTPKEREPPCN